MEGGNCDLIVTYFKTSHTEENHETLSCYSVGNNAGQNGRGKS
jgi:hypothetical protein